MSHLQMFELTNYHVLINYLEHLILFPFKIYKISLTLFSSHFVLPAPLKDRFINNAVEYS